MKKSFLDLLRFYRIMVMSLWPTFLAHAAFPLLCNTFESLFLILDRVIVFFFVFHSSSPNLKERNRPDESCLDAVMSMPATVDCGALKQQSATARQFYTTWISSTGVY